MGTDRARARHIGGPIEKVRVDWRGSVARRSELLPVDRRSDIWHVVPEFLIASWSWCRGRRCGFWVARFVIDRDCDDVVADGNAVPIAQTVRCLHAMVRAI